MICKGLEDAAKVSESQSGSYYVTLSMNSLFFEKLKNLCAAHSSEEHKNVRAIAELLRNKLKMYEKNVNKNLNSG